MPAKNLISYQSISPGLTLGLGGYVEYHQTDNLSFRGELFYAPRTVHDSFKSEYSLTKSNREGKQSYSYLELPLLLTYSFDLENKPFKPYILAGLTPAFMLSWRITKSGSRYTGSVLTERYEGEADATTATTREYNKEGQLIRTITEPEAAAELNGSLNKVAFNLNIGGGLQLENGLNLELRYMPAMTSVYSKLADINYSVLRLSLGYRIGTR
jgi:hypothetical protein